MTHSLRVALMAAWLILPQLGKAADGSVITAGTGTGLSAVKPTETQGTADIKRFLLCDGDPAAAKTCTPFDTHRQSLGTPSRAIISWVTSTNCTGADTVTPIGSDTAAMTVNFSLGPVGSTALSSGQQMVIQPIGNRYLSANIVDANSDCTDVEVTLQLIYDKGDEGH